MVTIGITGGYATGKTAAAVLFKKLGAEVLSADKIARMTMSPDTEVWTRIVGYFGRDILSEDKTINRKKLAKIVFADKKRLRKLNSIVHPAVKKELRRTIEDKSGYFQKKGLVKRLAATPRIFLVEVPLLFEAGMKRWFDKIIVVTCSEKTQLKRAIERDKVSKEQIQLRIKSQLPLTKKIKMADFVVDNNGRLELTEKQVRKIWNRIIKGG